MGKVMVNQQNAQLYKTHVAFGLIVLVLTVVRLVWLFMDTRPDILPMANWRKQAFTWNHRLILLVVVLMLFSGVSMLLFSGLSLSPANVAPDLIQDVAPRAGHRVGSLLLLLLFLMHAGGVLSYQFTKGGTLRRMGLKMFK